MLDKPKEHWEDRPERQSHSVTLAECGHCPCVHMVCHDVDNSVICEAVLSPSIVDKIKELSDELRKKHSN